MIFWPLFMILLLLWGFCTWVSRRKENVRNRRLPGPGQHFLGGVSNLFALRDMKKCLKVFERWCRIYGPVFTVKFGLYPMTVLNSPDYVQKLLGSKDMNYFGKGFMYKPLKPYWHDGLIISKGENWRFRRRVLEKHLFSFKTLRTYMKIFNKEADNLVRTIGEIYSDKKEKGIEHVLMNSSLNVITQATLGKRSEDIELLDEDDIPFSKGIDRVKEIVATRVTSPWLLVESLWRLRPLSKMEDYLIKLGRKYALRSIDDVGTNNNKFGIKQDMMAAGVPLEGVLEESLTLISAGYETTASSLHFLLFFLALYPEHQERCRNEVDSIFEDIDWCPSGQIQLRAFNKLKHLEMCVYETLRLLPTVFLLMRKIEAPLQLEEDLVLTAGSEVIIFMQGIHKNPEFFPDPEKFIPERFLAEESKARHSYAFIPFSGGPRGCIGQKFAMMEMMTLAAKLLRHHVFETTEKLEDIVFLPHITLTPDKPIKFLFKRRN